MCVTDSDFNEFASRLRSLVDTARVIQGYIEEKAATTPLDREGVFTSSGFLLIEISNEIDAMERKLIEKRGACANG